VAVDEATATVEDLASSNGTWVGNEQVDGTAALNLGDHLKVGATTLELREGEPTGDQPAIEGKPADPPATKVPLPELGDKPA
jgi:pSer/pThr/pTyr-binding forkhead associated (FHA) protein